MELYSARCATVHNYGSESELTKSGKCRQIGFFVSNHPEVDMEPVFNDTVSSGLLMIEISTFARAFMRAMDSFLVSSYASPIRAQVVDRRFQKLMHLLPW